MGHKYIPRLKPAFHLQLNERTKHSTTADRAAFKWNARRTLHMSTSFGLTSGFLCHYWYIFLDRSVVGGTGLSLVARCKDYTIVALLVLWVLCSPFM